MSSPERQTHLKLFVASFIGLFLELAVIRWVSTEVRIFAYISNLVLLACFLGFGLGCFYSRRPLRAWLVPVLLLVIVAGVQAPPLRLDAATAERTPILRSVLSLEPGQVIQIHPFGSITDFLGGFEDGSVWYDQFRPGRMGLAKASLMIALGLAGLGLLFTLIAAVFFPIGQLVGLLFDRSPSTVTAYSWNVAASLLGIWGFASLSFLYLPPTLWLFALLPALAPCLPEGRRSYLIASVSVLVLALSLAYGLRARSPSLETMWSPYQKLELRPWPGGYALLVNNVGYMTLVDLSDSALQRELNEADRQHERAFNQYDLVFRFHPAARDVLILGAGAGNNAAGALRHGVERVDAVEIDPGIVRLGTRYHPEAPYRDPRVHVVIDDARSFLHRTDRRYDLISLGLLDSHTLVSAYNNTRLDHYVYTRESIAEARRRLAPGGVLSVIFAEPRPWIGWRLRQLLEDGFGAAPLAFEPAGRLVAKGGMYIIAEDMAALRERVAADPELSAFLASQAIAPAGQVPLTTDDWPYLYLRGRRVPWIHVAVSTLLVAALLLLRRRLFQRGQRIEPRLFFLGAGFLLLEFQNISKAALIFGSTWLVNAFIISGILTLILAANLWVSRRPPAGVDSAYAALGLALAVLYFFPFERLNDLAYLSKAMAASLILNLPIFFAGIVFVRTFARAADKGAALGSNLLGAACGGLLEALSFVTGVRALLLVVLALYLASWRSGDRVR